MRAMIFWTVTTLIVAFALVAVLKGGGKYDGTTPRHYDFR